MRAERVQATKHESWGRIGAGSPARPWVRIAGWAPVLILAALLLLPAAAAQINPSDHVQTTQSAAKQIHDSVKDRIGSPGSLLFFTEAHLEGPDEPDDRWNFTAVPPHAADPPAASHRSADPHDAEGYQASWNWYLPTTHAIWNVRPGDHWELVLYIEGLAADPDGDSSTSHPIYTINVQALTSEGVHANGTTETSRFDIGEGPRRYAVTALVDEHHEFFPGTSDPQVQIQITVSTTEDVDPELRLHYDSLEHPSRLMLPRYPHDALTEMRTSGSMGVQPTIKPPCTQPVDEACGKEGGDGDDDDDGDDGSSPQNAPQDPSGSDSASTVKTGADTGSSPLLEESPDDEGAPEKQKTPDAMSTASTSGVIALLAWTLFVASAGSYGRPDRTKQTQEAPRIVGRPKQPESTDRPTAARAHTRKDTRKDR